MSGEYGPPPSDTGIPTMHHPELHGDVPDKRDDGVTMWYDRRERLANYDPAELQSVLAELKEIPEVIENEHQRVTLRIIAGLPALARDHLPEADRHKLAAVEVTYASLVAELEKYIAEYADTVIRFQRMKIVAQLKDPEEYQSVMKTVDTARKRSHDALMSHLNIISRQLTQAIPKAAGSTFRSSAWEDDIKRHWFSLDELHDRKRIGAWAIQQDIVNKSEAIEAAIQATLEQQDADAG